MVAAEELGGVAAVMRGVAPVVLVFAGLMRAVVLAVSEGVYDRLLLFRCQI